MRDAVRKQGKVCVGGRSRLARPCACVHPTACNPRLRRTTCCGANTLCSSCASSCFASRCDLRTLLRRCYIAFWGAAKIARTTCPMSCPQQRAPRGLQRSPERRSYAVAESSVRAPGREWRWFPEPRRTAHWCVVIHFDVLPRACQHSAGRWPRTWRSLCCCHALPLGSLE